MQSVPRHASRPGALPSYEEELLEAQRQGVRAACWLAGPLLLAFTLIDWVVMPDRLAILFTLRLAAALLITLLGSRVASGRGRPLPTLVAVLSLVVLPIEAGVILTDGTASIYLFAGMLPMAGAGTLVPLRPREAAIAVTEVTLLMLVPVLFAPVPFVMPDFATAVAYYATLGILVTSGAIVQDQLRQREYQARHEAARQLGLANVGTLAGGLAHELANPLSIVSVELERLAHNQAVTAIAGERVQAAERGVRRMREVLDAMRHGARVPDGALRPVALVDEVELALTLLQRHVKGRVEIVRAFEPVPPVRAERTLVGQVLVNLLLNAAQALEGRASPRITVRTCVEGACVVLEVEDNGPGVPVELRQRIFEPLFTTKGDAGNGLGLWLSAEIARAHSGELTVRDGAQGGARFRLALPLGPAELKAPVSAAG